MVTKKKEESEDKENTDKSESDKKEKINTEAPLSSETKAITAEEKKAKLLERAKKLAGEVKEAKEISKEQVKTKAKEEKELAEKKDMLVPIEDYLKSSIYLGTRVVTPDMSKYVYRRRADGLAVFNTTLLDEK